MRRITRSGDGGGSGGSNPPAVAWGSPWLWRRWRSGARGAAAKVLDAADEQGEPEHDDEQLDQLYITPQRGARLAIAHAILLDRVNPISQ
jgi:hypothetical protein